DAGHRAGPGRDLPLQLLGLPLQAVPALRPARELLAPRRGVRGVLLHPAAEVRDLPLPTLPLLRGLVARLGARALEVRDLPPDRGVLRDVAGRTGVVLHRLLVAAERLLLLPHLAGEVDDGAVGLVLREGRLERRAGAL